MRILPQPQLRYVGIVYLQSLVNTNEYSTHPSQVLIDIIPLVRRAVKFSHLATQMQICRDWIIYAQDMFMWTSSIET